MARIDHILKVAKDARKSSPWGSFFFFFKSVTSSGRDESRPCCRVVGPESAPHRFQPLGKAGRHRSRGGEAQSEVWDSWSWLGGPRPARRPGLSGSQALRHPGTSGSCGRAENRVGGWQTGSSLRLRGKKRGAPAGPMGRILGLTTMGLILVWWLWLGAEKPSNGDSEGHLCGSPQQILVKRVSPWF